VSRLDEVIAARRPILRWDPARYGKTQPTKQDEQPKLKKVATPVVPTAD
jgi:hypothetical protein